jgi:probable rRNA maturation factor
MKPNVEIARASPLWRALPGSEKLARRAVDASLAVTGMQIRDGAELSLQLVDDARIRALNAHWRGIDKATNVLSFPAAAPAEIACAPLLGDIVIAFETVEREAAQERKSLADHTVHLIVHGFLHLLGFDHESAAEADRMEAVETAILARLEIANPYASTDPVDAGA